jgi:hypothetical protein
LGARTIDATRTIRPIIEILIQKLLSRSICREVEPAADDTILKPHSRVEVCGEHPPEASDGAIGAEPNRGAGDH